MEKKKIINQINTRAMPLDKSGIDETTRSIPAVVLTEMPTLVYDWRNDKIVREVISIEGLKLPASNQVPLLDNHSLWGEVAETIKGGIRDLTKNGTTLTGRVYFSELSVPEWTLAKEGFLTDISAGYKTDKRNTVILSPGARQNVNGVEYNNDYNDGLDLYIRTTSELKEGSLTPIGADEESKMMRSQISAEDPELQKLIDQAIEKRNSAKNENAENSNNQISINQRSSQMADRTEDQIRKEERERINGIEAISKRFANNFKGGSAKLQELANVAVSQNDSVDNFRALVFENYDDSKPLDKPATQLDLTEGEKKQFSITRAINAEIETRTGGGKGWEGAGYEKDVLAQVRENVRSQLGYNAKGLILPFDLMLQRAAPYLGLNKRAQMNGGTVGDGGYLVGTQLMGNEYIEVLRNKLVPNIRIITGLRENLDFPKGLTSPSLVFGAESFAPSVTKKTFGKMSLAPKEGKISVSYSRKLFSQSNPSVDAIVTDDLMNGKAVGQNYQILHGAGTTAPTGLANTSGVGSVIGAGFDWAKVVELETDIATANADVAAMRHVMNPGVRGLLKTREKIAGFPNFLMNEDGKLNGYEVFATNQANAGYNFFGDWTQVFMTEWNVIDLLINPYKDETGDVIVTAFVLMDVGVRTPAAFSIASGIN